MVVRVILFLHLLLIALIARPYIVKAETQETKIKIMKRSVIMWLASLGAIAAGMILSAVVLTVFYTRSETYTSGDLIWYVESAVAVVIAGASGWIINKKLSQGI